MKVGDKIKISDYFSDDLDFTPQEINYYKNQVGTILEINEGNTFPYVVDIPTPDGEFEDSIWAEEELEPIE